MGLVRDDHDQQDQGAAEGGEGEMFRAVGVLGLECLVCHRDYCLARGAVCSDRRGGADVQHYGVTHEEDIASVSAILSIAPTHERY